MNRIEPNFGQGFYTASDASFILNIPYAKISYWFRKYLKGDFQSHLNYIYYYDIKDVTAVNFYTLIETYIFYLLKENNIKTKKIIIAHRELSRLLNTPYPFAHSDMLLSGGGILFNQNNSIFEATPGFQRVIPQIIIPFSRKIEFKNKIANKYYPIGKENSIVINPDNQFGSPIVDGTNIKVSTLVSLYKGGEKIDFISHLYKITDKQVLDALTFAKAA